MEILDTVTGTTFLTKVSWVGRVHCLRLTVAPFARICPAYVTLQMPKFQNLRMRAKIGCHGLHQ